MKETFHNIAVKFIYHCWSCF